MEENSLWKSSPGAITQLHLNTRMTEWPKEASDWGRLGWPWLGHWLSDRTKDRTTTSLWVQGGTALPEYQDRPDVFSGVHSPGEDAEPLRQEAPAPKLRPLQPGSSVGLGGWAGQAAAPSSVGPVGADTSICRVPSLALSHSALLIDDD